MIELPAFNIGFSSIAEARSQVSRIVDIIGKAFKSAVTLIEIADAVRTGRLQLDRLQTPNGLLLLSQNGCLKLREFQHGTNTGVLNKDGGVLLIQNGALKYLGTAGTFTTVAPS